MAHDYETFATAARTQLNGHIYQCVYELMVELRKNAEHFGEWQDELWSCDSIEAVQENQYRIILCPDADYVQVVEVTEIDQDDHEVDEFTEVHYNEVAQWLWDRMRQADRLSWLTKAKVNEFD
jgi:hypothetical protein